MEARKQVDTLPATNEEYIREFSALLLKAILSRVNKNGDTMEPAKSDG